MSLTDFVIIAIHEVIHCNYLNIELCNTNVLRNVLRYAIIGYRNKATKDMNMSAFIVDTKTIQNLVNFTLRKNMSFWNPETSQRVELSANQLGQVLLDANYESVNARYREEEKPEIFKHKLGNTTKAIQIIKSIQCLEYQSCEFEGWDNCFAKSICNQLLSTAIRYLDGYEEASWG